MVKYNLVNPHVEGKFDCACNGKTPSDAAANLWERLSEHLNNNIPQFGFTIQKASGGSLHHFSVSEKKSGETVTAKIDPVKVTKKAEKEFLKDLDKFKTMAGGAKDEFDDEDDEFDDAERQIGTYDWIAWQMNMLDRNQPFAFWRYYPFYPFPSVYVPTFIFPMAPYVEVVTSFTYPKVY